MLRNIVGCPGWELGAALVHRASLVAQMVKNLPTMQETWVWSLGQEDPLKEEMATHSPGGLQSMGWQRVKQDLATNTSTHWFPYQHWCCMALNVLGRYSWLSSASTKVGSDGCLWVCIWQNTASNCRPASLRLLTSEPVQGLLQI